MSRATHSSLNVFVIVFFSFLPIFFMFFLISSFDSMVLSDIHLKKLLKEKKLVITPFSLISNNEMIRSNHIDLHLGEKLLKYSSKVLDLKNPEIVLEEFFIPESGFTLAPGDFVL